MTPGAIDRVFGRGRLRMVTGDHVEVFREEAQPGERRRYTKRFLATPEGDFRHWTEREWRILARLVGHGIGPVPDVVQFDRGAAGRQALVQTYDAGVTIDHWATLLPVQRDGTMLAHVFEDCAHWWALARASLVALDAIHEIHLVHLDLKADNVCIPVGPAEFDPGRAGDCLHTDFERIALIDFAFSLVSGERLDSALPIARQTEYDYQSPRLLHALEEGSRGNLRPTRQLDWRCDLFSLAAMLRRYLPDPTSADAHGWTVERRGLARALVRRLLEVHDAELATRRPHGELIAVASAALDEPGLVASLRRGWSLGERTQADGDDDSPTPITRIALPLVLVPSVTLSLESIELDRSDVEGWAAANPPRTRRRGAAWVAAFAVAGMAVASVPMLGEAWRAWMAPAKATLPVTSVAAAPSSLLPPRRAVVAAPPRATEAPAAQPVERTTLPVAAAPVRAAPVLQAEATMPVAAMPSSPAALPDKEPVVVARSVPPPAAMPRPFDTAPRRSGSATMPPRSVSRGSAAPSRHASPTRLASAAPRPAPTLRPFAEAVVARTATRGNVRTPIFLPPAVGLAPLPTPARIALAAPSAAEPQATLPRPTDESAAFAPVDYAQRGNDLLAMQIPRIAQRAERMVLRVLFAAARADEDGRDDDAVRREAGSIRLAPDDPQLVDGNAAKEARGLNDAARAALRRGDLGEAVALQTRAFGANPVDPEVVGGLAFMRLRQGTAQAEAARRLALHALTLHDWKHPAGRIEDWHTFAIASALSGHERDARNAWLVALALGTDTERECRAGMDAYALYGEPLRTPVEAMLYRANVAARSPRSRLCEWPPHWAANVR